MSLLNHGKARVPTHLPVNRGQVIRGSEKLFAAADLTEKGIRSPGILGQDLAPGILQDCGESRAPAAASFLFRKISPGARCPLLVSLRFRTTPPFNVLKNFMFPVLLNPAALIFPLPSVWSVPKTLSRKSKYQFTSPIPRLLPEFATPIEISPSNEELREFPAARKPEYVEHHRLHG